MSKTIKLNDCYLSVNWPVSDTVSAVTTTRKRDGGGGYKSFNLSLRSGGNYDQVVASRGLLVDDCRWAREPIWLEQVHGANVVDVSVGSAELKADASVSREPGIPAMVMTADCLPVLFSNANGSCVAAAHAGWKGLAKGVLENTIEAMDCSPLELMAWLGPAISQEFFEVGPEVRDAFIESDSESSSGFISGEGDRWMADLYFLARHRLNKSGVTRIYGGQYCTYKQEDLFFSYRRDGKVSGRMASAIWIKQR